jgi:hypothetical protein
VIKKIIKNRRELAKGTIMVTAIYALIVMNHVRTVYERNTATFNKDY